MWTDKDCVQQSKGLSVKVVKSTPDETYHAVDFADNLSNMLPECEISVKDYTQILLSGSSCCIDRVDLSLPGMM